jgi:hypothetical protein
MLFHSPRQRGEVPGQNEIFIARRPFMRLALVTEAPINETHGTGCLLLRLLDGTKNTAINVHPRQGSGQVSRLPFIAISEKRDLGAKAKKWVRFVKRHLLLRGKLLDHGFARNVQHEVSDEVSHALEQADVVLCSVHSLYGLQFVRACLSSVPPSRPVVFWFLDCSLHGEFIPPSLMKFMRDRSPGMWAFNAAIRATLARVFPELAGTIENKFWLGVELPCLMAPPKKDDEIKGVMIGNFWDVGMVKILEKVWRRFRERSPRCGPLSWFAPPQALERLTREGVVLSQDIRYQGFASSLADALKGASVAVVPFSAGSDNMLDYAQHSFPSRIADYCAHGVPVFALAPSHSLVAQFIAENGIGISHDVTDVDAAADCLVNFLSDSRRMEECRRRTRALAETEFDLTQVRQKFWNDLAAVTE